MKNTFRSFIILALSLVLAITMIACGPDDESTETSADTTTTPTTTTSSETTETPIESQPDNNSAIDLPIVP